MAAVATARDGEKVVILESSYLMGGMMSGGLTKTDMGRTNAIGGMAREFYDRVLAYYTKTYGADSSQVFECNHGYYFESKLALELFDQMLDEAHVTALTKERLEEVDSPGQKSVPSRREITRPTRRAPGTERSSLMPPTKAISSRRRTPFAGSGARPAVSTMNPWPD